MKIQNRLLLAILFVALFVLPPMMAAQRGSSTENVTTTVYDKDANGGVVTFTSDDANGSGYATYQTNCSSGSVMNCYRSWVGLTDSSSYGWWLYLGNQTSRHVCLNLTTPVNGSPAPPPFTCNPQNQEVGTMCYYPGSTTMQALPSVTTSSTNCSFGFTFYDNGTKYRLVMTPNLPSATCPSTGCPATGTASVTCTATSSGQCVNWTIVPSTGPNATIANLYYFGKLANLVYVGQYYVTYRVGATYP